MVMGVGLPWNGEQSAGPFKSREHRSAGTASDGSGPDKAVLPTKLWMGGEPLVNSRGVRPK